MIEPKSQGRGIGKKLLQDQIDYLNHNLEIEFINVRTTQFFYKLPDMHHPPEVQSDFDSRYSQSGVQWPLKEAKKDEGIIKEMTVQTY